MFWVNRCFLMQINSWMFTAAILSEDRGWQFDITSTLVMTVQNDINFHKKLGKPFACNKAKKITILGLSPYCLKMARRNSVLCSAKLVNKINVSGVTATVEYLISLRTFRLLRVSTKYVTQCFIVKGIQIMRVTRTGLKFSRASNRVAKFTHDDSVDGACRLE